MNLSITFTGMCLFVPDTANGRLKVLLPHHNHGEPSDRHNAQIKLPGQGWESLDNCELNILEKHVGGGMGVVPPEVLDISDLLNQKVAQVQTTSGSPGNDLAARIILPLPSKYEVAAKKAKFRVKESNGNQKLPQELVHQLTYQLNNIEDFGGPWLVSQLGEPEVTQELFRPSGDQDVSLEIRNVPRCDPPIQVGQPVRHFHGYLHMFPNHPHPAPEVILDAKPVEKGLTAYTCMLGQGDHDP